MEQKSKSHPAVAALIVIVLIGIVTSVVIVVNSTNKSNPAPTSDITTQSESNASHDSTDTSNYKDGTYSATGSYLSPGGRESIQLSVTIKDGVITDTTLQTEPNTQESEQYQNQFSNNYKGLVVGKKINGLSLSRVAGSSLTSNGFNDALDEIRSDARA